MQVQLDPDQTGPRLLIEAVQDAGFDGRIVDTDRYVLIAHRLKSILFSLQQSKLLIEQKPA